MRLLIAEDDPKLLKSLVHIFQSAHYAVDGVSDGSEAFDYAFSGEYDGLVLDIMMPGMDGVALLKKLRQQGITTPALFLTARGEIDQRIEGLDAGADDYLPKPFDTRELLARIRSISRTKSESNTKLTFGNIVLNRATFELTSPTGSFRLANKEYQMMEYLMVNPHRIISTEMFMEKIWGYDNESEINVVWVYISYLRKKLAALGANIQIKSSRNAGYSLEDCDV